PYRAVPCLFLPASRNRSSPQTASRFHPAAGNAVRSRPLRRRTHSCAAAATPALRVLSPPVLLCSGEAEKSRILLAPFADGIASQSAFPFFLFHPGRCLRRKHRKSAPAQRHRLPRLVRPRVERRLPWFPHRNNREPC